MGDRRYAPHLEHMLAHGEPALSELSDLEVLQALAATAMRRDERSAYLSNVLASEAMNRFARSSAAVEHMAEAVVVVDAEGLVRLANPAAERLLGWREGELRGVDAHAVLHVSPDGDARHSRADCPVHQVLRGEADVRRGAMRLARRDGGFVDAQFSAATIRDEMGGAVVVLRGALDVTT